MAKKNPAVLWNVDQTGDVIGAEGRTTVQGNVGLGDDFVKSSKTSKKYVTHVSRNSDGNLQVNVEQPSLSDFNATTANRSIGTNSSGGIEAQDLSNVTSSAETTTGTTYVSSITQSPNGQVSYKTQTITEATDEANSAKKGITTLTSDLYASNTRTTGHTTAVTPDGVWDAIDSLDVNNITDNLGASKTLSALSETDGKISATAISIQIAESQVTNLTTDLGKKADKVSSATDGHLASLDASGNLKDSGKSASDFAANADVFEVNANVTSFSDALAAYNDGKKLVLTAGRQGPSPFVTQYEIPLYRVVVNGNTITQFVWIASDDAYNAATGSNSFGSIMYYKLSSTGWTLGADNIDFAKVAGTAGSASTAEIATKAANDILGSAIEGTYVCNAKLVNGGGGTLYPGSSFNVLSDAAIKSDDATIGNRKYVELKYMSYGLGIGTRIQQVGTPYMTYNNPDTYLELSKTAFSIAGRNSQDQYCNALTSQLMGTYHNLIEVDFDYDIVATNSTGSIGVAFCLASTSMVGTPQTTIATNDGRIFAFATVSGQGVGGHLRGHLHITGYLQSSHVLTGYGLCIGAQSIYGDYSGTCTLKITNVNIKDSYATYT